MMMEALLPRQIEIAQRSSQHGRAGRKHTHIIEVLAVPDELARGSLPKEPACLRERFPGGSDREHDIIFGDDEIGGCRLVAALPTQGDDLHAGGQGRS